MFNEVRSVHGGGLRHSDLTVVIRLTPLVVHGFGEAGVLDHTGDLLSRFRHVLQMGVDLIVPVSISHLLSGRHVTLNLLPVPQPRQRDGWRVKSVSAAHQCGRVSAV